MNKLFQSLVFILCPICLWLFGAPLAWAQAPPQLTAGAAILIDMENQQILLAKNPDALMYPASTTKIMTALVALEKGQLDDVVTVSAGATGEAVGGSVIGLRQGEQITLHDLLYALMLPSANDAAVAVAEHISGTVEDFAVLMNQTAEHIGAQHTQYVNPHGLSHPDHYTTARDLAQIALAAVQNDTFREIVATPVYRSGRALNPGADQQSPAAEFTTTNLLLRADSDYQLPGTTGIKTGYTSLAGRCLVFSVQQQDRQLLGVLLNSPDFAVYQDAHRLARHGFKDFRRLELAQAGQHVAEASIKKGLKKTVAAVAQDHCIYYVPVGQLTLGEPQINWQPNLTAPIKKGSALGTAIWTLNDEIIGEVQLIAAEKATARPPLWVAALLLAVIIWLRQKRARHLSS